MTLIEQTPSSGLFDTLKSTVAGLLGKTNGHAAPTMTYHPLNPLSLEEMRKAVDIIRADASAKFVDVPLRFMHLTLLEPPKVELVPFLLAFRENPESTKPLERLATALISQRTEEKTVYTEYIVSLDKASVVSSKQPDLGEHAPLDPDEMVDAEKILLDDPEFIEVVRKLELPENAVVVADSWPYGCDTFEPDQPRLIPFMLYFRLNSHQDTNHYAYPLPLIPAIDSHTGKLHSINYAPIYGGESTETIETLWAKGEKFPWHLMTAGEYHTDLRAGPARELKALEVVQKDGPGFTVEGYAVEWQKWSFRVGFNYREGLVLHDVRYDGRDVFHRLSISDMTVPYGDPRAPFHRKQAFDLGDVGAGVTANQLDLGCDCLGLIHYFSADLLTSKGDVKHVKNVVCMHEQDEGVGWKHTNYRSGNAVVVRNRVLVLQTIITVANYEYIFAWKFDQAANIHLETRATGILSTHTILPGETSPYGTIVSPGVLASNHQHIFSVRIDPAIGALGEGNTVVQEDSVAMPFDAKSPPKNNPYGVGYTVQKTIIGKSGWADAAPMSNRIFKIINPTRTNPISGRQIGYKLVPMPSQLMLSHPDSVGHARAEFADHHVWVTSHRDEELYSGGKYTNQSNGGAKGIKSWVARDDTVENADLVLWHSFGLTHNPRVEDFPVMPSEIHMVSFKPVDFFTCSPSNDVPASTQKANNSVLYKPNGLASTARINGSAHFQGDAKVEQEAKVNGGHGNANGNGHVNGNGCCK